MQLGDYRIEIIPDTEFRLDGGAMFGVVPRVVWERVCPPDPANRIRLNMNCLFVETATEKILVETGIGEKWTEKQTKNYGIFRAKPFAETLFEKTGCRPADITIVVNTHLHFDHAGGNTIFECGTRNAERGTESDEQLSTTENEQNFEAQSSKSEDNTTNPHSAFRVPHSAIAQFPNARYFVSESEFRHAENPHERDRASYLAENWRPLQASGQLELKPDVYEVVEGLTIENARGHSETMQTVRLKRGGETLYGFADLIPTRHHLALPWIMGYDLYPTETLEFKKQILPLAVKENWICLFYHDFEMPLCRLTEVDGKLKAIKIPVEETLG
ncbi:MAG TPA: MBL fold metallo-hydrolase [Pyrinomonadaceae bacterium]|nr:MBL fold metallo-hydrolase [Pyrinomonadaceae bacterium]